jgi:Rad3-related DNA helicase
LQDELNQTESHFSRNLAAIQSIDEDATNWVFWQEQREGFPRSGVRRQADLRDGVHQATALRRREHPRLHVRLPWAKRCLLPEPRAEAGQGGVALTVEHVPERANRPIHMMLVGSMGRQSADNTTPSMLRMCERILKAHATEKGLIHCHSYRLGEAIHAYLAPRFPGRIIFPKTGKERDASFLMHKNMDEPTVMLSPSMTEGFNMQDDLARFQILAKMPYPYLGDKQVAAKKARDPDWYDMQTVMTVLQACGRIVRSDTDHGATYILDSDFQMLFERHPDFFPAWFQEAFVWHKK